MARTRSSTRLKHKADVDVGPIRPRIDVRALVELARWLEQRVHSSAGATPCSVHPRPDSPPPPQSRPAADEPGPTTASRGATAARGDSRATRRPACARSGRARA
jgi:hypothetical protein